METAQGERVSLRGCKRESIDLEDVMQAFKRARASGPFLSEAAGLKRHERLDACGSARLKKARLVDEEVEELVAERLEMLGGAAGPLLQSALVERHVEERLEEATDELERRLQAQLLELQATVADHGRRIEDQQEQLDVQARRLAEQAADLQAREARHLQEVRRLQTAQDWQRQVAQAEYESLLLTMQRAEAEHIGRAASRAGYA